MAIFNMNSDDTIMQAIHAINQSINQSINYGKKLLQEATGIYSELVYPVAKKWKWKLLP